MKKLVFFNQVRSSMAKSSIALLETFLIHPGAHRSPIAKSISKLVDAKSISKLVDAKSISKLLVLKPISVLFYVRRLRIGAENFAVNAVSCIRSYAITTNTKKAIAKSFLARVIDVNVDPRRHHSCDSRTVHLVCKKYAAAQALRHDAASGYTTSSYACVRKPEAARERIELRRT